MENKQQQSNLETEELIKSKKQVKYEKHSQNGWDFTFSTSGIMPTDDLDRLSEYLHLNVCPDVVFGQNKAILENKKHNFVFEINPRESLRFSNFQIRDNRIVKEQKDYKKTQNFINHINIIPSEVKVKLHKVWKDRKVDPEIESEIKPIVQYSDPFFCTGYKGTVRPLNFDPKQELQYFRKEGETKIDFENEKFDENKQYPYSEPTEENIPLGNLTPENPIIWQSILDLWEDELDDNGETKSQFRFRTMKDCFFGLIRFYLRLDDVIIRIYDTRIYHDYNTNYILREFSIKEDSYQNIAAKGFQFTPTWMIDQYQSFIVQEYVKQVYQFKDKIYIGPEN